MGERLLCKQEVIGSIPFTSTTGEPRLAARQALLEPFGEAERASPVRHSAGKAGARSNAQSGACDARSRGKERRCGETRKAMLIEG